MYEESSNNQEPMNPKNNAAFGDEKDSNAGDKKIFIVMHFESGNFTYDLMTFLSDFVKLYMNTLKRKSIGEAANNLTVARNTLDRLVNDHKSLSWGCYKEILSALLQSDCPYPENDHISICEEESLPYETSGHCSKCKYFNYFQESAKKCDTIRRDFKQEIRKN